MYRFDADDSDVVATLMLGEVVAVERFGSPIQVLVLTYADGRRINLAASDDDLVIGEENIPQC